MKRGAGWIVNYFSSSLVCITDSYFLNDTGYINSLLPVSGEPWLPIAVFNSKSFWILSICYVY